MEADPTPESVDEYIVERLIGDDLVQAATMAANRVAGLPPIDVSPAQGKFLMLLARVAGARRVLEVGTLGGYSTIWLARALPQDGRLVTLELDEATAGVVRANVAAAGFAVTVEVRTGPAADSLRHDRGGRAALRSDLYRRGQAELFRVSETLCEAFPARHGAHLRQCRAAGRGRAGGLVRPKVPGTAQNYELTND